MKSYTLESGNNPTPVLYTNQVGRYEFRLSVEESFGEETIPEFISGSEMQTADTSAKPLADRTVEVINLGPVVNFDVIKKKKADIVFTIGEVDTAKIQDLHGKITQQIETKLAAKNIDYGTIQSITASTFSSNDADAAQIFNNWTRYGTNKNTWQFDSANKIIKRENNDYWAGFYDPNFSSSEYSLDVDLTTFNSDNDDIGITFGMDGGPNGCFAYILSGDNGRRFSYSNQTTNQHGHATGLYQYNGSTIKGLVDNHSREFRPNTWHHLKLQVSGKNAKIWLDGDLVINYTASRELKGSYGFFTNSQPLGAFKNLTISSKTIKTLDDILKEPSWREYTQKFLVNISDVQYPEFNNPQKAAVIYSRLLSDSIYFNVLGTGTNQAQAQSIIAQNNGKGVFITNSNMDAALSQLADYIIAEVEAQPRLIEKYALQGEEVEYKTYYEDQENDPKFVERWIHAHDPYWFKNSLGEASFDGQYLPGPVTRFDKVGKYNVQFQARDNPKPDNRFDGYRLWSHMPLDDLELYVHRRPLALYSVQITPNGSLYNVAVQDQSYDPDHQGEAGNGIIAREWRWKEAAAATWNSNNPSTLPAGKTYLFSLKVQDLDGPDGVGEWSLPNVRTISTSSLNMPPVAQFAVNPNPLPLGKTLIYNDLSYGPNGDPIVQRSWRMAKLPGGSWTDYGGTPPNNFTSLGVGDYRIELKVKDQPGAWSEPFYQTVTVIPDNNKPIALFTVSPNPLPQDVSVSYSEASWDPDGDPIVAREWQWQKNSGSWQNGQPLDFNALGIGSYNIRLRVKDQPALAQMTPLWSDWYLQNLSVIVGNRKPVDQFAISPNPALTDEAVTYSDTSYDPDGVGIAERVWQVTTTNGTVLGEYHNQLPPRVFAGTGWGDGGAGTYRIGLRVRDNSPNGISPLLWSDWTWQTLTVVMPLTGSGEITPNPALSGMRVHIAVDTSGYAEEVRVKFPGGGFFNGDEITLLPESPVSSKLNTWRGTYLTDAKTPDGAYAVMATVIRTSVAPQMVTVPLTLVIQGDIYDQIKVRIRDSR